MSIPSSIFKNDENNVYYNIIIKNEEEPVKEARFLENRVQPILDHPNEYEVGVVRFSVPSYDIPIMFFRNGEGDYKNEEYVVSMSFDGESTSEVLQFVENEQSGKTLYGKPTIWNYQEMIDSINNGLASAFATIKALKPLAPPTAPPFFTYDPETKLISFWGQTQYDTSPSAPPTIKVFVNEVLFKLFPTFRIFGDIGAPVNFKQQMLIQDTKINSTTYNGQPYYKMTQEAETLYLWYDFQSIAFETNTIPVNPEFLPAQNNVITRIITDFEPLSDDPSRQTLQYFPQGPIRFYDLKSAYPLNSIDLSVQWIDKERISYPVYLTQGDLLTCKLQFRRKSERVLQEAIHPEFD